LTQSPIHFAVAGGLALLMALLLELVPLSQVARVSLLLDERHALLDNPFG
jgi:hypothetical protein